MDKQNTNQSPNTYNPYVQAFNEGYSKACFDIGFSQGYNAGYNQGYFNGSKVCFRVGQYICKRGSFFK